MFVLWQEHHSKLNNPKCMKRDLRKVKHSNNLLNIIIDVGSVEGPNLILEILVFVEFVSENMLEKDLLWDSKKLAGKIPLGKIKCFKQNVY
jgi:hypothetical protein